MLLAFDVGNTNIAIGVFKDGILTNSWRMQMDSQKSADEYGMLLNQLFAYDGLNIADVEDVIISTVVPPLVYTLRHLAIKYFNRRPIIIEPGIKTGLLIKYDNPKQLGADRIVNAVGAFGKYGGAVIIVDLGTATTFCAVTPRAEYLGGTIAPGLKISLEALVEKTAKLPKVELNDPQHVICRNTIDSMKSGLVYGHMGMIEMIVAKMKEEMRAYCGDVPIKVIATGGLSALVADGAGCIDVVDKMLTLDGLQIIYEKNKNLGKRFVTPDEKASLCGDDVR